MTNAQNKSPPQHTRGPWADKKDGKYLNSEYQIERERGSYTWFPIKSGRKTICLVVSNKFDDPEHKANGQLISAAPELLNALECLEIFMQDVMPEDASLDVWTQARAAIAKAKGGAA
jgi:hypothetical protein